MHVMPMGIQATLGTTDPCPSDIAMAKASAHFPLLQYYNLKVHQLSLPEMPEVHKIKPVV